MRTAYRIEVTAGLLAAASLEHPDYASAFAVATPYAGEYTAMEWIRAIFEGAAPPLPRALRMAWRFGLLARPGAYPTADRVLGYPILHSDSESVVFTMDSPLLCAHNVVQVDGSLVHLGTFVRYRGRLGRAVWAAAAPIHHWLIPLLMHGAPGRVTDARPDG